MGATTALYNLSAEIGDSVHIVASLAREVNMPKTITLTNDADQSGQ
jgi:hypothetical protein